MRPRNVDFKLTPTQLRVGINGRAPVIEEDLWGEVDVNECTWFIEQHAGRRCVAITLMKRDWDSWRFLSKQEAARTTRRRLTTAAAVFGAAVWLGWNLIQGALGAGLRKAFT